MEERIAKPEKTCARYRMFFGLISLVVVAGGALVYAVVTLWVERCERMLRIEVLPEEPKVGA